MRHRFLGVGAVVLAAAAISAQPAAQFKLPLLFERNEGQTDRRVQFLGRGSGYTVFLTGTETVLALDDPAGRTVLRMKLAGANANAPMSGVGEQRGRSNYLIGADPTAWRRNVPSYAKVRQQEVYRGIDALFYANDHRLEYDFVVAPGADPGVISVMFQGADSMRVDGAGDLVLEVAGREVRQHRPVAYQEFGQQRRPVPASYVLRRNRVAFQLGAYDRSHPLVIDPIITYSTFLGGNYYDWAHSVALDRRGNAYLTGTSTSADFPTTAGAMTRTRMQYRDGFVAKFDVNGQLIYSTLIGGDGHDEGFGIAVDADGFAYITGDFGTLCCNLRSAPVTPGAFQTPANGADVYVFKLTPNGDGVVYGARIGGTFDDRAYAIALDAQRNAVVTGTVHASLNFPTVNAAQPAYGGGYTDAFLLKLNASGSALVYSTYLGGGTVVENNNRRVDEGFAVAVDVDGNAYVTGFTNADDFLTTPGTLDAWGSTDVFARKYTPTGALVYSTRFGSDTGADIGRGIAVDPGGNAYLTGDTNFGFPTTPGAFQPNGTFDAFVSKLNPDGTAFVYSTYLGGVAMEGSGSDNGTDVGNAIAVNAAGEAYVTGGTRSRNFPTRDAFQSAHGGDNLFYDAFVTKLNAAGSGLIYSTYLGANGSDTARGIALDPFGNAYVVGMTSSTQFPTTPGAFQRTNGSDDGSGSAHDDAFLTKISSPSALHVIAPCRLLDTRGGGALPSPGVRTLQVSGRCGVPSGATAVAAIVTVVRPQTAGYLSFHPAGFHWPATSTISYREGRTRANGVVLGLPVDGAVEARNGGSPSDFLIDVTGYWK